MQFWTYMLVCSDNSIYVGHTDNIELRLSQHRLRTYSGYTSKRLPVRLIWCDVFRTRDDAFAAERQIKGWSRAKKLSLARGDWEAIRELAGRRTADAGRERWLLRSSFDFPQDERAGASVVEEGR